MIEKRRIARNRTYLGGKMVFNHSSSTMDCLVRNLNADGAKLVYSNSVTIPGEFELQITQVGTSKRALVIWRRENETGVVFVDKSASVIPIGGDLARRLRAAEARNASLSRRIEQLTALE